MLYFQGLAWCLCFGPLTFSWMMPGLTIFLAWPGGIPCGWPRPWPWKWQPAVASSRAEQRTMARRFLMVFPLAAWSRAVGMIDTVHSALEGSVQTPLAARTRPRARLGPLGLQLGHRSLGVGPKTPGIIYAPGNMAAQPLVAC